METLTLRPPRPELDHGHAAEHYAAQAVLAAALTSDAAALERAAAQYRATVRPTGSGLTVVTG